MTEYLCDDAAIQLPIDASLPTNLANAIRALSDDPALRAKMGQAGRKRSELFTKQRYYEHFLSLLDDSDQKPHRG